MQIKNSIRLWSNHDHSPMEIRQLQSVSLHNTTLILGSSTVAKMLREAQPELEQLGFQMDLDSNADIIPTVTFPKGMKGEAEIWGRKIYPKDPCLCGSGRKYKKCYGRKM